MKKFLKILLKSVLGLIGILILGFVVLKMTYNEDLPEGKNEKAADELAYKILESLNYESYKTAKEIHWMFRGTNLYEWKKQEDIVEVFWGDFHVSLNTKFRDKSTAFKNDKPLEGVSRTEAIDYALSNFNNDSFWVVAPYKIFDPGTKRFLVEEEGKQKLLVQYTTGGSTPGDAYLWEVDENYKPISFKMWVSIIPFNGIEAEWSDWKTTDSGFMLAHKKTVWGIEIPVTDLKVIP